MHRTAFDFLFRTVMMVLAGLVSLSLVAALNTVSQGSGTPRGDAQRGGGGGVQGEPDLPRPQPQTQQRIAPAPTPADQAKQSQQTTILVPAPPPTPEEQSAHWLQVIAWTLLALAGLAALLALLLWRVGSELRRAADAAETLAARPQSR